MDRDAIKFIKTQFSCRENFIEEFDEIIGDPDCSLPNSINVFGHRATGKTSIITEYFKRTKFNFVYINLIECYTKNILFENIIDKYFDHKLSEENNYSSYAKCDGIYDFLCNLRKLNTEEAYVICLDNAEKILDLDSNILPSFVELQKFTELNICTILISLISLRKFLSVKLLNEEVIFIYCPQYTKNEIKIILLNDFEYLKNLIKNKIKNNKFKDDDGDEKNIMRKINILEGFQIDFYENYLETFLNVFYPIFRDLPELKFNSSNCFEIYCEPVLKEIIDINDKSKLWKHITIPFRRALSKIYTRIDEEPNEDNEEKLLNELNFNQSDKKLAQLLELPYYAKYLLIASFLASYNAPKEDKRLFVKNHGKKKKHLQSINAKTKVMEKLSISLGPKSFTIDRLLAIFYAIVNEKVGLTCNLLSQISSLIQLKFLVVISGELNMLEGSMRLQCTVNLDFILNIGKIVGFNVRQYLYDLN